MRATRPTRLGCFVVSMCALSAAAPAAAAPPPPLRWQGAIEAGNSRGAPHIGFSSGRVIVGGTTGGDLLGDFTDASVWAFARRDGAELWSRVFDSGNTDTVSSMIATTETIYVVGNSTTFVVGQFHSESFVLALRARDGAPRWQVRSSTGNEAFGESLYDAALQDGKLFVVGTVDSTILVRALDAASGTLLWQDTAPHEWACCERANVVLAAAGRVYVAGDRDTTLGRSAPYVVRGYDAVSGERLWETQFGQQVNNARGLQILDGTLVVGGHYWDIGPGVRRMEIYGLDPDGAGVRWRRSPAGRAFSDSYTSDLLVVDDAAFIGGRISRVKSLPALRPYDAAGASPWIGAAGEIKSGAVNALAASDGAIIATGTAATRDKPGAHLWLRASDTATGVTLWEQILPGLDDSSGAALATDADDLAVAGVSSRDDGPKTWLVRLYRLR